MNLKNAILGVAAAGSALLAAGCASVPAETRVQGIAIPSSWLEKAEKGADATSRCDLSQAQACLALSKALWDRDVLESIRYLRKGAALRDAESCRQYLAHTETPSVNVSQRLYARLFIEGLLRKGAVYTRSGQDIRGELFYQLCWAWRYTEPCCLPKAKQVLEAMLEYGAAPAQLKSAFITQMLRENGLRADARNLSLRPSEEIQMYAAESADDSKRWLSVPLPGDHHEGAEWIVAEARAWGGGTDRLFFASNVLAFLVNDLGEPSFRGTHLWICNLGTTAVYLTSLSTSQNNRELLPGQEELIPVVAGNVPQGGTTTEVPLSVRHPRLFR